MKKKSIILIVALVAFNIQSCKDFLKEELVSDVAGVYYTTATGLEDAVDGAYSYLKYVYSNERAYTLTVFGTDTYTNGADGSHKGFNWYDATLRADNSVLREMYEWCYKGVNQSNAVIGRAAAVADMDATIKKTRVAEAKFLRALYYFTIIRQWGSADLRLEETVGAVVTANKTSAIEVYAQAIIPDLTDAIADLPAIQPQYGRATKGAAQNLMGMALLTRGWLTNSNADFAAAEANFSAVIANASYGLVASHAELWDQSKQNNKEIIFAVQNSTNVLLNSGGDGVAPGEGNRGHLYFLMQYDNQPGMIRDIANGRPFKRFRPTDYLLNLWGAARDIDNRYDQTYKHVWYVNGNNTAFLWTQAHVTAGALKKNGIPVTAADIGKPRLEMGDTAIYIPGPGRESKYDVSPTVRAPKFRYQIILRTDAGKTNYNEFQYAHIKKFMDPLRPTIQWMEGSRDWFVMRLADTYLLRAEARLKQANAAGARADVVFVRQRAAFAGVDMNDVANTPATITLDYLLDERARELDAEQSRWYDLVRTQTLVSRVNQYNPEAQNRVAQFHTRRPIIQNQLDRTQGGYEQNCGYPDGPNCN
ncbi:MAG: RagB/SusD family nutrient uptake outer membrane protein [Cyclobacteriaceae bacterium]|nr:RagB/SusD family nutrient uptake outer membrane protein [Cyclobacteriaceae bacterium]